MSPSLARSFFDRLKVRQPRTLAFLVAKLDPAEVDDVPVAVWERLSARRPRKLPKEVAASLDPFFLAVGLRRGEQGRRLVVGSFEAVHASAATGALASSRWAALTAHLPDLGLLRHWDRCESLRRGLADRAVKWSWPAADVLAACRGEDAFKHFVATCRQTFSGRRLLSQMLKASRSRSAATAHQRRVLRRLPPEFFLEAEGRAAPRSAAATAGRP